MTALTDPATEVSVVPGRATPCQALLDGRRRWGRTLAVRTGSQVFGVRGDTEESVDALADLLGPLLAPEYDDHVAATFSVEIGQDDPAAPRRLFLVYRAHQVVARRHDRARLLSDLVTLLDDVPRAHAFDLFGLHAGLLVTASGEAILLPADVHRTLLTRRRQLEQAGACLRAARTQRYDATTGEVVTGAFDRRVAEVFRALPSNEGWLARIPVSTWCVGAAVEAPHTLTGADAVIACLGTVLNREQMGMGATLRGLQAATHRHRIVAMPDLAAGAQAAAVLELMA